MSRPDSRSRITEFDDLKEILYRYDLTNEDKKYFKNSLENKIFENNFFTNRNLDKVLGNQIFNKLDDYYEFDATSEKKLIEIATFSLNSSDYHHAKKFFDIILINNPRSIEALYGNSIIAHAHKNYDESLSFLDSILKIESNHSITLNQYGIIELERNNVSKAKNLFSKSIEFDDTFIDPKRFLAECEIINGDHQKGLDLYLKIVSKFKDDTVSMNRIADLLRVSGNEEEANKWEDVASKQTEYENTINPLP
jgi:Tfp pilus assembly protein PilF